MEKLRRWHYLGLAGLVLALGTTTGCQTWVAGMTLPSGHYLQHPPQYFPPSPAFPLPRELASMESQAAAQGIIPGAPAGPGGLPAPAPIVPAPGAGQLPMPAPAGAPPGAAGNVPPPPPVPNQ
jgi:hypothetical protein